MKVKISLTDRWKDGQMDGQTDGQKDSQHEISIPITKFVGV